MAISRLVTYHKEEFKELAGVTESSFRQALRLGLKTVRVGQKRFIRGADWESFLLSQTQQQQGEPK